MIPECGESKDQEHLKITTCCVFFECRKDQEQWHDQENVDPIYPGTLSLFEFPVCAIHMVGQDNKAKNSQKIKDEIGSVGARKPDVEQERRNDKDMDKVELDRGRHTVDSIDLYDFLLNSNHFVRFRIRKIDEWLCCTMCARYLTIPDPLSVPSFLTLPMTSFFTDLFSKYNALCFRTLSPELQQRKDELLVTALCHTQTFSELSVEEIAHLGMLGVDAAMWRNASALTDKDTLEEALDIVEEWQWEQAEAADRMDHLCNDRLCW